jgi:osmotically-inducible protein OsmY
LARWQTAVICASSKFIGIVSADVYAKFAALLGRSLSNGFRENISNTANAAANDNTMIARCRIESRPNPTSWKYTNSLSRVHDRVKVSVDD